MEFEILADYNPLPEGEAYGAGKKAKVEKAGGGSGASTKAGSKKARGKSRGVVLKPSPGAHAAAAGKTAKGGVR